MLLHVLGVLSRLPTTDAFSLIIPCITKMWGLAAGSSEAKLENSITDQLTSFSSDIKWTILGFRHYSPKSGRLDSSKADVSKPKDGGHNTMTTLPLQSS